MRRVSPIPMRVTLDIPDDLATQLMAKDQDSSQAVLEALLVDAYRRNILHEGEIKRILGHGTRMQAHELLKKHGVPLNYTIEDLEQDRETMRRLFDHEASTAP